MLLTTLQSTSGRLALLACCLGSAGAADATRPIDYTQRNRPYAAEERVAPAKQNPQANRSVQQKRVDAPTVERRMSPLGERDAAFEAIEARTKQVREKDSHRPEAIEHSTSRYNQRLSSISTTADTRKPPTVAKYQDSLAAASATNMARFPALDRATSAKINRFVFRRNPAEPVTPKSAAVPAGGGSARSK